MTGIEDPGPMERPRDAPGSSEKLEMKIRRLRYMVVLDLTFRVRCCFFTEAVRTQTGTVVPLLQSAETSKTTIKTT